MHWQRNDDDPQGQIRAVEAEVEFRRIEAVSRYPNQPCLFYRSALERCDKAVDGKPSDHEDPNDGGTESILRCSQ